MKIFVTGGNGFLGKHWISNLSKNHQITAPSSADCDLMHESSLFKFANDYDLILHLAAYTQAGDWCLTHPGEQWIVNQRINTNVLLWWFQKNSKAKLISIGTSCSYDPEIEMVEENYLSGKPERSLLTYAMTKRMLYQGMCSLNQQFNMNYLHLIPGTLYGPNYQNEGKQKHFIFDLIDKIILAKRLGSEVVLWGDGTQERELVYVDDFVTNANYIINNFKNDSFNLGSNVDFSIKDYAKIICEIIGFDPNSIIYDSARYTGARKKLLNSNKALQMVPNYRVSDLKRSLQYIIKSRI